MMKHSQEDKQTQIYQFYQNRRFTNKNRLVQNLLEQQRNDFQLRSNKEIEESYSHFSIESTQIISTKINLREKLFFNIDKLQNQTNYAAK